MSKDLGLSQSAAGDAGLQTPLGALAHDLYGRLVESGGGDRDFSAMIEFLRGAGERDR